MHRIVLDCTKLYSIEIMQQGHIQNIVIVGGGTAGWMTAAALSALLDKNKVALTLVESEQIGTVGVGEATLPHLRFFIKRLGIDEQEFMRKTNATYKTGIEFINWGRQGDAYIHPFGDFGQSIDGIDFHHFWLKQRAQGASQNIGDYSLPVVASKLGKFDYPATDEKSILSTYSYAFHLDAGLFAKFLRDYSEKKGLTRVEGIVKGISQHPENGFIRAVTLDSGQQLEGDLFIDCSGFRGLLIEQTLKTGYEDWRHWLPCDRAIAIPTATHGEPLPYTKATARDAGWQWRIPLQNRTGNGHIYSSAFTNDDRSLDTLLKHLDAKPIGQPNFLRFTTGRRKKAWNKNCVAIGLSAGFLEPLESTSIHLIQLGIMKLQAFFPDKRCESVKRDEYNRMMQLEFERLRDFLVLHYHATERTDSDFWHYVRTMSLPDGLSHKIALFKERGHVVQYTEGLFLKASWLAVYLGQRIIPSQYDWNVDAYPDEKVAQFLKDMQHKISSVAQGMSSHMDSLLYHNVLAKAEMKSGANQVPPPASMNLYSSGGE